MEIGKPWRGRISVWLETVGRGGLVGNTRIWEHVKVYEGR